jgi:hypothetical protein
MSATINLAEWDAPAKMPKPQRQPQQRRMNATAVVSGPAVTGVPKVPPRAILLPTSASMAPASAALHVATNVLSRKTVRKLNLKTCERCDGFGASCNCGTIEIPWFGNTFVNDGHQNFAPLHQYFVLGGLYANVTTTPVVPVVYSFAAITKNTVSVSPAATYTIADLADIGLVATATTTEPRVTKFGDLFLVAGLTGANAIFNGEYRVITLPTSADAFFVLQSLDGASGCLAPRVGDVIRTWFGGYASTVQITAITNGVLSVAATPVTSVTPFRNVHVLACQTGAYPLAF